MANCDLATLGDNSSTTTLNLIAEAQHMAYADRFAHLSGSAFADIPLEALESKAFVDARRAQIITEPPMTEAGSAPWPFHSTGSPLHCLPPVVVMPLINTPPT